jgi:hypothetical protein
VLDSPVRGREPGTTGAGSAATKRSAPGSVLAQDIPDGCLTTCRTDVAGHPGRSAEADHVEGPAGHRGRSPAEVVAACGVSRSRLYGLLDRYRAEGDAAFEPRSRRRTSVVHAAAATGPRPQQGHRLTGRPPGAAAGQHQPGPSIVGPGHADVLRHHRGGPAIEPVREDELVTTRRGRPSSPRWVPPNVLPWGAGDAGARRHRRSPIR